MYPYYRKNMVKHTNKLAEVLGGIGHAKAAYNDFHKARIQNSDEREYRKDQYNKIREYRGCNKGVDLCTKIMEVILDRGG